VRGAELILEQPAYEQLTVVQLRRIARENHIKLPVGVNKADIIRRLSEPPSLAPTKPSAETIPEILTVPSAEPLREPRRFSPFSRLSADFAAPSKRPSGYYNEEYGTSNPAVPEMLPPGFAGMGVVSWRYSPMGMAFCARRIAHPDRAMFTCPSRRSAVFA